MAGDGQLINRLRQLLREFENGGGNGNGNGGGLVCPPTKLPCATVCMVVPPPIMAPTVPQPVKPLRLPCPVPERNQMPQMSEEEAERTRYSNFYNNYNVDWHSEGAAGEKRRSMDLLRSERCKGVTTDGKNPCCDDYRRRRELDDAARRDKGCPTGFKPCTMKLQPPADCHPCGVWCAEIQPCPPKPKKVSKYTPGECARPCCKHWKPKDGPCKYDEPCRAHCFNHPPGIKPRRERQTAAAC